MKKFIFLSACFLILAACEKDNITETESPTGNTSSDNNESPIDSIDFSRTVQIVFSNNGNATVTGATDEVTASINGNGVTIRNTGTEKVRYQLSGSTSDGYLKIYSNKKMALELNGVSITNPNGAAINIQDGTAYVVVSGTNNLSDGASYTSTPSDEDEKAAFFSEDQLIFSGTGSLTVTATGKNGIASDDYIHLLGSPSITVSSTQGHGIRGKDYILIDGGTLNISTSAASKKGMNTDGHCTINGGTITINVSGGTALDSESNDYKGTAGIKADSNFTITGGTITITNSGQGGKGIKADGNGYFYGGNITVTTTGNNYGNSGGGHGPWGGGNSGSSVSAKGIKCIGDIIVDGSNIQVSCKSHEGIESKKTITIKSGEVYSYASDDAINSASTFTIDGGFVCGYSTGNDGLDANGNFYINGGLVYAIGTSSPELGIDANTEGGYKLYVNQGCTLVAIGGLERGSTLSQDCYQASSWTRNVWYSLTVAGNTYAFKTPSSGGTPLVVSGTEKPTLKSNVTVSNGTDLAGGIMLKNATTSGGTDVSLSTYNNNGGGGGGWW